MLKYIFVIISDRCVACGRDLGRGQNFLIFLSLADHVPDECMNLSIKRFSIGGVIAKPA